MKKRFSSSSRSATTYEADDDVDDDTFLKASRSKSFGPYGRNMGMSTDSPTPITATYQQRYDSLEDQKTQLINRKTELENRTLESAKRSVNLLRESEDVGIATAEELSRQREQLENTNARLNEINENLHTSSKHIQGISSIFGSLKNYWASRKSTDDKEKEGKAPVRPPRSHSVDVTATTPRTRSYLRTALENASSKYIDVDDHPALRIRGISSSQSKSSTESDDFQGALDRNLDDISNSLGRLKGLAAELGQELDSQNYLLEDVIGKTDKADINIEKQNKDIKRLLKK